MSTVSPAVKKYLGRGRHPISREAKRLEEERFVHDDLPLLLFEKPTRWLEDLFWGHPVLERNVWVRAYDALFDVITLPDGTTEDLLRSTHFNVFNESVRVRIETEKWLQQYPGLKDSNFAYLKYQYAFQCVWRQLRDEEVERRQRLKRKLGSKAAPIPVTPEPDTFSPRASPIKRLRYSPSPEAVVFQPPPPPVAPLTPDPISPLSEEKVPPPKPVKRSLFLRELFPVTGGVDSDIDDDFDALPMPAASAVTQTATTLPVARSPTTPPLAQPDPLLLLSSDNCPDCGRGAFAQCQCSVLSSSSSSSSSAVFATQLQPGISISSALYEPELDIEVIPETDPSSTFDQLHELLSSF